MGRIHFFYILLTNLVIIIFIIYYYYYYFYYYYYIYYNILLYYYYYFFYFINDVPTWCTHARILNYTADSEGTSISWVNCWEFEFDICILYTVAHMADIFLKPKEEKWAQKLLIPRRKRGPSLPRKTRRARLPNPRLYVFLRKMDFTCLRKKRSGPRTKRCLKHGMKN